MPLVNEVFTILDSGLARGLTSALTLLEVLVTPLREGRQDLAQEYTSVLTNSLGITLYALDEATSVRAAMLWATYDWLRTPDAIQIATALEHGTDLIVTNDDRWRQITVMEVLILKDYVAA